VASLALWHENDPFSTDTDGTPRRYAERAVVADAVAPFIGRLEAGRFAPGIAMVGARGSGKTVELRRLSRKLLDIGVVPLHLNLADMPRTGPLRSRS
jgi:hypothetical protein